VRICVTVRVLSWVIASGPREFGDLQGFDMDVAWSYDLERDGYRRPVSVVLGRGCLGADLPDDAYRAVVTQGRSAVEAVCERDEPPRYLLVSRDGVAERAE
jgi:hypothetical protein